MRYRDTLRLDVLRQRFRSEVIAALPSLAVGIMVAMATLYVTRQHHGGLWGKTGLGVLGDGLGFYIAEFYRRFRSLGRETKNRLRATLGWLIGQYLVADVLDVTLVRGWTLLDSNWLNDNVYVATLVGNLAADVIFFGIILVAGSNLSDLVRKWYMVVKARLARRWARRVIEPKE